MTERSQYALLGEQRLGPFFAIQFFGTLNDNVLKNALVIVVTYQVTARTLSSGELASLAQALFILPFFLVTALANTAVAAYIFTPVPVMPMVLKSLSVRFFSRKDGPAKSHPFRLAPFAKMGLAVAAAVTARQATPEHLHALVLALRGDRR